MCGVVGFLNCTNKNIDNNIVAMLDAIHHRGPDDCGYREFQTKSGILTLGHKRLSILDLSKQGHQPMTTNTKDLWITYNGEVFNFQEIRDKLVNKGYKFKSHTDTEVVLYAYQEYGKKCLDLFRGFFSFCIYDKNKQKLFLARDRMGVKPLKYYFDGNIFSFASELRSLITNNSIKKELDFLAITQFLNFKYIPAPQTIFKNTFKLEAGHYLEFDLLTKKINIENYWQPFNNSITYDANNIITQTEQILTEAVNIRKISDVPIGVFLSGGVDSSVITALLRKNSNSDINTFSMGFAVDKFDESAYAREVADKFDTHHIEFNIDYDFKNDIESIITSYDEPFADPSIIPSYYLAKETSQYVKVVLGGDGGDEVFGGYKRYNIHSRNNFLNYLPNKLFDLNNYLLQQTPYGIYKKQGWGRFNRSLEYFANSFIDGYYLRVANFTQKDIYALMGKWDETIWSDHINKILANSKLDNLNKITLIDQLTHLPEYILNKSDISGMSHSLEIRSPFTDYKLVEFVNNLPAKYKNNKSLLKEIAIKNGVPKDIVYRKKMGFTPPLRKWTADIKDNIGDVLFSDNLSFLNREVLQDIYDFHYKNNEILASKIWGLYVLGVWLKYYIK